MEPELRAAIDRLKADYPGHPIDESTLAAANKFIIDAKKGGYWDAFYMLGIPGEKLIIKPVPGSAIMLRE